MPLKNFFYYNEVKGKFLHAYKPLTRSKCLVFSAF